MVVASFLVLHALFEAYPAPAFKLAEDVRIIRTANPTHRAVPGGGSEMRRLALAINGFADAYCAQRDDVDARISDANTRLEAEKNRFAALLSDLTQGVLVCNSEGRILLYNARAQQLLDERGDEGDIGGAVVGLGRSIFAVIDKSVIVHALDAVRHKWRTAAPTHRRNSSPPVTGDSSCVRTSRRFSTESATSAASS